MTRVLRKSTNPQLQAGGLTTFTITPTTVPQVGTVVVNTTNNIGVACNLNGVSVNAPLSLANQSLGIKSLNCTAPSGYTITITSSTSSLIAGGTMTFVVALTAIPQVGTINFSVPGYNSSVYCVLNDITSITINGMLSLTNQSLGTKALWCANPIGYTVTSITPSSQALTAGGTVTFAVALTALPPFSISCALMPNPVTVGQVVTGTISQSGGVLPITYTQNAASLGTNNTFSLYPNVTGMMGSVVTATDARGRTVNSTCTGTVVAKPTTGTVNITTTNNISVACNLGGVSVNAPVNLSNQVVGTKTLTCTAPAGYTITVTPTSQALTAGGTVTFVVTLTAIPQVGTVYVNIIGYSGAVSCMLSGVAVNPAGLTMLTNQPIGSKSLSCTPPYGYNLAINPSSTQTLSVGGVITFAVTFVPIPTLVQNKLF